MCWGGAFEVTGEDAVWELAAGAAFELAGGAALPDDGASAVVLALFAGADEELFPESDVLAADCAAVLLLELESDGEDADGGATFESGDALVCCAACVFR